MGWLFVVLLVLMLLKTATPNEQILIEGVKFIVICVGVVWHLKQLLF